MTVFPTFFSPQLLRPLLFHIPPTWKWYFFQAKSLKERCVTARLPLVRTGRLVRKFWMWNGPFSRDIHTNPPEQCIIFAHGLIWQTVEFCSRSQSVLTTITSLSKRTPSGPAPTVRQSGDLCPSYRKISYSKITEKRQELDQHQMPVL